MSSAQHHHQQNNNLPTAVVAGGAGFLGAALCKRLLLHNLEVICVDNLSTGKRQNIQEFKHHPHFHFLKLDVTTNSLTRITRAHYIFHLIDSEQHQTTSQENLDNLLAGTNSTRRLLDLAHKFKAKFLLASSTNVYNAFLSTNSLRSYFGPTTQSENFYSLSEAKRIAEAITAEFYKAHHLNTRIVRLIDLYGPNMDIHVPTPIASFIKSINTNTPLIVKGDGLQKLYPTYISDAVEGLMKATFSTSSNGQIFTLANPTSITELNLAFTLRELVSFHLQIQHSKQPLESTELDRSWFSSQTKIKWKPQVSLEDGLTQTLKWLEKKQLIPLKKSASPKRAKSKKLRSIKTFTQPPTPPSELPKSLPHEGKRLSRPSLFQKKSSPTTIHPSHKPRQKRNKLSSKAFISGFVILLLLLLSPIVIFITTSALAVKNLKQTQADLIAADISSAQSSAQKSKSYFSKSKLLLKRFSSAISFLNLDDQILRLEKLIGIGSNLAQASIHLTQATQKGLETTQVILGNQNGDSVSLLSTAQAETTRAYELLSLSSAELQDDRPNLEQIPFVNFSSYYQTLKTEVPKLRDATQAARQVLSLLPKIIGSADQKKTYLLLLQNNAELRPTGGFIGSFALISFQNAKLLDFVVEDVYTADGQLKGHVEPPAELKKYLGEATWYLRDVNWDPDFPSTARQAEWFLQKEIGRNIDGVIAINLFVAQNLLEAVGELQVPDYSETITSSNLFARAQYHSEVDFFPGSTQKKDFLAALVRALYSRIQELDGQDTIKLAQALSQSLKQSQILISLQDQQTSQSFKDLNWDGSIRAIPACTTGNVCYSDYLKLVEANVGVNKANFFIKRKLDYQLRILKQDNLLATTTINYINDSPAETWPGGTYKNYLRLYTPLGSALKAVSIGPEKLDPKAIQVSEAHGKTVFGFLVKVPIKSQVAVEISYRLPSGLEFKRGRPTAEYVLLIQKQSGIGSDPINIEINYPSYMQAFSKHPDIQTSSQITTLSSDLAQDRQISISFTK